MADISSMHIDWAKEMVARQEANKNDATNILMLVADDRRILNMIRATFTDSKTLDVVQTILSFDRNPRKSVTAKQRGFIAARLLEKFDSHRAAIAAAFEVSEKEMFGSNKKSPKSVMNRAWEIARAAVAKFGGKVREYFAESLKLAWAE